MPDVDHIRVVVAELTFRRPRDTTEVIPILIHQAASVEEDVTTLVVDNDPGGGAVAQVSAFAREHAVRRVDARFGPRFGISGWVELGVRPIAPRAWWRAGVVRRGRRSRHRARRTDHARLGAATDLPGGQRLESHPSDRCDGGWPPIVRAGLPLRGSSRVIVGSARFAAGLASRRLVDRARGLSTAAPGAGMRTGAVGSADSEYKRT